MAKFDFLAFLWTISKEDCITGGSKLKTNGKLENKVIVCFSTASALIWCCLFWWGADTSPNLFLWGGFPAFLDVLVAAVR